MKMKDLVQEALSDYDIATIGRRGKDSADDDEAGMSDKNFSDHPANQLKKILNIGSLQTIKTADGKEVEMSDQTASLLLNMIDGSKPGSIASMFKPSAVERMTSIVMDSDKLQKLVSAGDANEMKNLMANMASLSAADRKPEASNY
jgi:hypothetical protein